MPVVVLNGYLKQRARHMETSYYSSVWRHFWNCLQQLIEKLPGVAAPTAEGEVYLSTEAN